jgi:hypothetical protein
VLRPALQCACYTTDADEVVSIAKKKSQAVINSVPEGVSVTTIWPPKLESFPVDTKFLKEDPAAFLNDGKEVDLDATSRLYDPDGSFTMLTQQIKDFVASMENEDPLQETLHGMGMTQVAYRRTPPEINWDFYRKNIGNKQFVNALESNYNDAVKDAKAFIAAGSPLTEELKASSKRLESFFVEQMLKWQKDGSAILDEVARVEQQQNDLIAFGSRLEEMTVQEELEKDPELAQKLEQQLLEGTWTVEDEDIPVSADTPDDNTLERALARDPNEGEILNKKVEKAVWG